MGFPALAAPYHLPSGAIARRPYRDVLATGAQGTRRRPRGRLDRREMRACAIAAKSRGAGRDRRWRIAAAARGDEATGARIDRSFRIDLSRQATQRAARYL